MFEELELQIECFREYKLERLVTNSGGKLLHRWVGKALFEPHPSGLLRYSEYILSENLVGTRSYLYRFMSEKLEIFFDETPQRLFVALPDNALHRCGNDLYEVRVLRSWPMEMQVRVQGPSKDYLIVSTLG